MKKKELITNILDYLDTNLYTKISINQISKIFFFNKDYIMRVFKNEVNITIFEYINYKKVYMSLDDLIYTNDSILSIALRSGFSSQEYFSEIFKKIIGINPSTYRKFYKYRNILDINLANRINENVIKLDNTMNYIDNYRKTVKRKDVLVLSMLLILRRSKVILFLMIFLLYMVFLYVSYRYLNILYILQMMLIKE